MTPALIALLDYLKGVEDSLPRATRHKVYKVVRLLAAVATLVLLGLPLLPKVGVDTSTDLVAAGLTFLLTALSHLAAPNSRHTLRHEPGRS
jgi:hypothetical protein